jgi:alpha-L-fucosidase 2
MKKLNVIQAIFLLAAISGCAKQQINNQEYVARYKAVFTHPPQKVPTPTVPDGPISGNGDLGIVFGGKPDSQNIYISKVDFWKAKRGYPDGGVCLPGGLTIVIPELKDASYYTEQLVADGTIRQVFKKDGIIFHLTALVPSGNNSIIIEMSTEGTRDCPVNLNLWANKGLESTNKSGESGEIYWVSRSFDSSDVDWPTHIVMAMKTIGADGSSFTLKPRQQVYVVISACTNHDNPDYFEKAIQKTRDINESSVAELRQTNKNWWKDYWAESLVQIGDTTVEKYYYASHYILACCSRNRTFPPGLWGNSLTMDATFYAWEGDYHTNYNHQAPWWGSYSSNHISITQPYDQPLLDYKDSAKLHARKLLNCNGVYFPVGIGPKGFCSCVYPLTPESMMKYYGTRETGLEGGYMFCGQKSDAVFVTANMFMRFYSTYDKDYALRIYPFLKEVANFWEDYLKFENGRYVSYNDNFTEVGPWLRDRYWRQDLENGDVNPVISMSLLRMFFKGITDVSKFLNKDQDKLEKWDHILTHLSQIPTITIDGKIRIKACEGGTSSGSRIPPGLDNWTMSQGLVFPGGISGHYTDPALTKILLDEVERWDWHSYEMSIISGLNTANRVGYDPVKLYGRMNDIINNISLQNLWLNNGGGVESVSGIPVTVNEMLLQSYEGLIRVFPNWLPGKDARFKTLRAYGAFLVSSEIKNNEVSCVEIISEKGRECSLLNPWQAGKVKITSGDFDDIPYLETGKLLVFKTDPGKKYLITQN